MNLTICQVPAHWPPQKQQPCLEERRRAGSSESMATRCSRRRSSLRGTSWTRPARRIPSTGALSPEVRWPQSLLHLHLHALHEKGQSHGRDRARQNEPGVDEREPSPIGHSTYNPLWQCALSRESCRDLRPRQMPRVDARVRRAASAGHVEKRLCGEQTWDGLLTEVRLV